MSALGLACGLAQAQAQESFDRGRTPAQLFASDCAECHRNPKAVIKTLYPGSLAGFLREHYTASKESAVALANYLISLGPEPRPAARSAAPSSRAPAPSAAKPSAARPSGNQGGTPAKPAEAAPAAKPVAEPKTSASPETSPAPAATPAEPEVKPPPKPPEPEAKPPAATSGEGPN
jgi:hypothetical protein